MHTLKGHSLFQSRACSWRLSRFFCASSSTTSCAASKDRDCHRAILLAMVWSATSSQAGFHFGRRRPFVPGAGSPASARSASKYSSKCGATLKNGWPSPTRANRSTSHFFCSRSGGSRMRPARKRATTTACHSKTRKVKPADTCTVSLGHWGWGFLQELTPPTKDRVGSSCLKTCS